MVLLEDAISAMAFCLSRFWEFLTAKARSILAVSDNNAVTVPSIWANTLLLNSTACFSVEICPSTEEI